MNFILKSWVKYCTKEVFKTLKIVTIGSAMITIVACAKYKPVYKVTLAGDTIGFITNKEIIKAKIENLQSTIVQLRCSLTTLKNIHVYSDGAVPAYTDAFSFLIAVYAYITDIAYELGRVEGYSSGQINAHSDVFSLKYDYNALKDSLISKD